MKTAHWIDSIQIPRSPGLLVAVADRILDWIERTRQRQTLGRLDERLLADIGLTRTDAETEADKPFWRE